MTLDNLKRALILNNKALLNRLKALLHTHNNLDVLNCFSISEDNKLLFNGELINSGNIEEQVFTDEQIEIMVNEVMAALGSEEVDPNTTVIYGYKKNIAERDPHDRIEYINDCTGFTPACMSYANGTFNYGDWKNAFFMRVKPVMLNFDGTVAYELDPNDYTKKKDGTASDVANVDFQGNAMVGIPTVWFKRETIDGYEYVHISNKQVDETYHAYAHTDENGNIMKYTYLPIYNGFIDSSGKLRSVSGVTPTTGKTMTQEITAAELNNPDGKHMWNIETRADVQMIIDLCILISKSCDSRAIFGPGNVSYGSACTTGEIDQKGVFYGTNKRYGEVINSPYTTHMDYVKVFGIEHFWGNLYRRVLGSIYNFADGKMKVKMTYGTQDGSTIIGYNVKGTGYIDIPNSTMTIRSAGPICKTFVNQYGRFPISISGSGKDDNSCECSYGYYSDMSSRDDNLGIEIRGYFADNYDTDKCGINSVNFQNDSDIANGTINASVSCKPNVPENILVSAS